MIPKVWWSLAKSEDDENGENTEPTNSIGGQTAYANYDSSRPCRIAPLTGCIREGCNVEGEEGELTASFGYINYQDFTVNIGRRSYYGHNWLTPRKNCPGYWSYYDNYENLPPNCSQPQPVDFAPGRNDNAFEVCYDKAPDDMPYYYGGAAAADASPSNLDPWYDEQRGWVRWRLRPSNSCWWCWYEEVTSYYFTDTRHSPFCNRSPMCEVVASCQPGTQSFSLAAWGSKDKDGDSLLYSWDHSCPGAGLAPDTGPVSTLVLNPQEGGASQSCSVELTVTEEETEDGFSTSCEAAIDTSSCPIIDCEGVLGGIAKVDRCGVCEGDGTSCLGCSPLDMQAQKGNLNGSFNDLHALVRRSINAARRAGVGARIRQRTLARAQQLVLDSRKLVQEVPASLQQCTNAAFCVNVANTTNSEELIANSQQLRRLVIRMSRRLRNLGDRNRSLRLNMRARAAHRANVEAAGGLPKTSSQCY